MLSIYHPSNRGFKPKGESFNHLFSKQHIKPLAVVPRNEESLVTPLASSSFVRILSNSIATRIY